MIIHLVQITARRIGLPHFDQCAAHRPPVFVKHTPMHEDAFSDRLALVLRGQIIIVLANQAVPEDRSRSFRQVSAASRTNGMRGDRAMDDKYGGK